MLESCIVLFLIIFILFSYLNIFKDIVCRIKNDLETINNFIEANLTDV